MDLIKELKSYCDINNPVGALMLSGEWGCGKTYLIKNFIKQEKDTYVFVSVSLFGIDSLDKLRVEVKKKWLEKASEFDKLNGTKVSKVADAYRKIFGTIKDILPENWQKKGEVVSSIMDLVNFVPISNTMFEKKVILVFDDLERSNISCTDLLGCINDYCENQSFNTIIIANEEKIKNSSDNELSYREIKEKIVQRVIPFVPDYEEVVSNSIELMSCGIEYKGLLRKNKELLVEILSGDFDDNAIIEHYKA
jgi:Cdc6-like AAA superfamily ATPase